MNNKIDWQDVIILILFIISIAVVLWHFLGNSPILLESLILLLFTLMFMSNVQLVRNSMNIKFFEKRFNKLEENIKDSFNNMRSDISLIKEKLEV